MTKFQVRLTPEQRRRVRALMAVAPIQRTSMNAVAVEAVEAGLPVLEQRWSLSFTRRKKS